MNKIVIYPIGSGSSGNSIAIQIGGYNILIDIGFSTKRIDSALKVNDLSIKNIDALLITHTHSDHIKGFDTFLKVNKCPIFCSKISKNVLNHSNIKELKYDTKIEIIDNIFVTCFKTSHDCDGSIGFIIEHNDIKLGYITDLGKMTNKILNYLKSSKVIIIESNHDIEMLDNGPYPYYLIERIRSDKGHLSNDDCANAIYELAKYNTKYFFLAHLSKQNNKPSIAIKTVEKRLNNKDIKVICLKDYSIDKYVITN